MQIIKLGGSIVTKRNRFFIFDETNVKQLALDISKCDEPIIIVHGFGSYGRAYLPCYDGRHIPNDQAAFARKIQYELRELHERIFGCLNDAGVSVRSVNPESLFVIKNDEILYGNLDIIKYYLTIDRIPLLYGGTLWDENGYYTILSSDQIVEYLAVHLNVRQVIWATDVDGVLTTDGNVLPCLTEGNVHLMWRQEYDVIDRTGGMTSKVNISLRLSNKDITSLVINGQVQNRLKKAILGECTLGTKIQKE